MDKSGLPKKTALEAITGSLPTEIGTTLLAAFCGTPVAALLPILTSTLANTRHRERVERTLVAMSEELERQKEALVNITDAQYKLINEAILATLQATDENKLQYLRNVLSNAVRNDDTSPQEADFLSRVIRDLSANEAKFLVENGRYTNVTFGADAIGSMTGQLLEVDPSSEDALIVTGLVSLGLLIMGDTRWGVSGHLQWSPAAKQLLALLSVSGQ